MGRVFRWLWPFGKQPQHDPQGSMPLLGHLDELRIRVLKTMLAVVIGTVIGFFSAAPVLEFLQEPYGRAFTVLGPTGGVVAYFRVALLIGGVISIPVITYQLLMFILPGLKPREKRLLLSALPAITLLFLIGVAFSWFALIPPALGFLEGFEPTLFKPEWTADLYLSFVTALIFWMGVAFEMPLVFFVVAVIGLITPRPLIRQWRLAVVVASIAAAVITPTIDPVNMLLVMGPLLVLYAFSILLVMLGSRLHLRRLTQSSQQGV